MRSLLSLICLTCLMASAYSVEETPDVVSVDIEQVYTGAHIFIKRITQLQKEMQVLGCIMMGLI